MNIRKKVKKVLILAVPVFCIAAAAAPAQGKSLNWNMGLLNIKSGEMVPFSAPVQSWTGEQFRIVIEPRAACFGYVVAESSEGDELAVLQAGPLKSGEAWQSEIMILSPPKGTESLFIIVSADEQKTLSQRISAMDNSPSTAQRRAVMTEIFRIRSDASKFKEAPEKPVLMGGASRGSPEKARGVEFSGLETYVKTISIEH
ncbi:MAG: hypothetical protein FWH38_09140 [Treponema sp.]|nr:hypothetical protein [Treponema sp.]